MNAHGIHLVRVTPDDRKHRLWAAATSREEAVDRVLEVIPEGWAARLLDHSFKPREDAVRDMTAGEVRELCETPEDE
ncbi:MAG: hypothetical protein JO141_19890 [Bradyrhizobium sp.]|nr:hypothetical protein [Bradyrhizobium sp.]